MWQSPIISSMTYDVHLDQVRDKWCNLYCGQVIPEY